MSTSKPHTVNGGGIVSVRALGDRRLLFQKHPVWRNWVAYSEDGTITPDTMNAKHLSTLEVMMDRWLMQAPS